MNNEIKEILDRIDTASEIFDCLLKPEECTELLDYITNLQAELYEIIDNADWWHNRFKAVQQENERLKENNSDMQEEMARTWKKCDDYKSRCEKAINFIEEMLYPIGSCVNGSDLPYESIESLLNILQNGSDASE